MINDVSFLTFIFISAFTPGPNNCMALSHAARSLRNGVIFSFGVFGGMLAVMLACGFLSGILAQNMGSAEVFMKVTGCAYMVWLAWSMWNSGGVADEPAQGGGKLLISGCLLQLVNPKLIAYGMTAFSVFLLPGVQGLSSLIGLTALLAVVGFAGTFTWALGGAALNKAFQEHSVLINRILAVTVLACAVSVLM